MHSPTRHTVKKEHQLGDLSEKVLLEVECRLEVEVPM
jgi:hypothetical protein